MNSEKKPLLSIVIPTYKRSEYLPLAIGSAINQNDKSIDYEIIVVNNDPESDITWLVEKFADSDIPISIYKNESNLGMLGNVNRCAELARGKYISYLHDDDLLLPNYIENVKEILLESETKACIIPCRYIFFESQDLSRQYSLEKKRKIKRFLVKMNPIRLFTWRPVSKINVEDNVYAWQNCYCAPTCGVIFNKDIFSKHGFFSGSEFAWDYTTFLDLNRNEDIYILHKPLSVYRMTSGASLRAEVQYDFFLINESLAKRVDENSKAGKYIKKYIKEMKYLNYSILSEEAKAYVREKSNDCVDEKPSNFKFLIFMMKRLMYYSSHHLDVEWTLGEKMRNYIINLESELKSK